MGVLQIKRNKFNLLVFCFLPWFFFPVLVHCNRTVKIQKKNLHPLLMSCTYVKMSCVQFRFQVYKLGEKKPL